MRSFGWFFEAKKLDFRGARAEPFSAEERARGHTSIDAAPHAEKDREWFDHHHGPEIDTRHYLKHSKVWAQEHGKSGVPYGPSPKARGIEDVPWHKIVATQSSVTKSLVHKKLDSDEPSKHPVLSHHKETDHYFVIAGHHRLAAQHAAGRSHAKAVVTDNYASKPGEKPRKAPKWHQYNWEG